MGARAGVAGAELTFVPGGHTGDEEMDRLLLEATARFAAADRRAASPGPPIASKRWITACRARRGGPVCGRPRNRRRSHGRHRGDGSEVREGARPGDFAGMTELIKEYATDDFVEEWPQSGERLTKEASLRTARATRRCRARSDVDVSADARRRHLRDRGHDRLRRRRPGELRGIGELREDKVSRMTEYFANPFEAPAWRAPFVETWRRSRLLSGGIASRAPGPAVAPPDPNHSDEPDDRERPPTYGRTAAHTTYACSQRPPPKPWSVSGWDVTTMIVATSTTATAIASSNLARSQPRVLLSSMGGECAGVPAHRKPPLSAWHAYKGSIAARRYPGSPTGSCRSP